MTLTPNQQNGNLGEQFAADWLNNNGGCLFCKSPHSKIKLLKNSFTGVDLVCDFCLKVYQVKTVTKPNTSTLPNTIPGAQWLPLEKRLKAGICHPILVPILQQQKGVKPKTVVGNWRKTATLWYLGSEWTGEPLYKVRNTKRPNGNLLIMTTIDVTSVKKKFIQLQ
jgi:hypothetical protein